VNSGIYNEEDFLKDCPNYQFIPIVLPPVKRIIAIGDIHGDLSLAIRSFKLAGLIDDNLNWIAVPPDTVVVQIGDQIDSCRFVPGIYDCHKKKYPDDEQEDISVLNFFDDMHIKASIVGGAVYSLLGNHELLNAQGKFDYVSYENFKNFRYVSEDGRIYKGPSGRKTVFSPGGQISKRLACKRLSVLIIGSTMFVHAGILPILARRLNHMNMDSRTKLKYLNAIVRKWLLKKLSELEDIKTIEMFLNEAGTSPFWTRIYGSIPKNTPLNSGECFRSVKKAMEVFNLGHLVVGHTPQIGTTNDGINGTCYEKDGDNKLYRIDGGFSRAFEIFVGKRNIVQVLEILDDKIFNIITEKQ
jgi:hypothetical protein